jgi:hypothetical protein
MAQIILKNEIGIDVSTQSLGKLLSHAPLSNGTILVSLNNTSLPEEVQAACIPALLIEKFAPRYTTICNYPDSTSWDCCVVISKEWCNLQSKFPAYFTYLLGHEIGHATICLRDISLHILCCLIHEFIFVASHGKIHPSESPHDHEIEKIKLQKSDKERERLEFVQYTSPSNDFSGLRERMVAFSRPYKDELIQCWKNHIREHGENSLASLILNYDALFEPKKETDLFF